MLFFLFLLEQSGRDRQYTEIDSMYHNLCIQMDVAWQSLGKTRKIQLSVSLSFHWRAQDNFSGVTYSGDTAELSGVDRFHFFYLIVSSFIIHGIFNKKHLLCCTQCFAVPSYVRQLFQKANVSLSHVQRILQVERSYKLQCPLDNRPYCLLYVSTVSTWSRRTPAKIKRCICELLLYQKLKGFHQLAVNPRSHRAKSAFIHILESTRLKHFWSVYTSHFQHTSTLLLKVSSAPFLRDKHPHVGFMPRVDMRNELPSPLSSQHQDIYFSCWCLDNMHKHQSRIIFK